ncbi:hypothetical protein EYZ11_003956 [Aspergillus tanneri]|uniref:Uncharacterized protein n=1 Tax=Aspergillus tanneri TaxID=1220188 RepID=A0A4V3UQ08_9EURO|nr:uncharacterized protein ATNIH1004_010948 [Aspergillus tanneri]KAA8642009.1 hypothetical protein ATNIH1004_010948 [Aspergillus tanneri]THC96564.1 hypothetical protein EYZ11_003956 [Aspergillus tanneri]
METTKRWGGVVFESPQDNTDRHNFRHISRQRLGVVNENLRLLLETGNLALKLSVPKKILKPMAILLLMKDREWMRKADYLIINAGAGQSTAIGLDYTFETFLRTISLPSSDWARAAR